MQIVQAILIGWLTTYFVSDVTPTSTRDAYLTAAAIALSVISISWIHAWVYLWAQEVGECVWGKERGMGCALHCTIACNAAEHMIIVICCTVLIVERCVI